MAVQILPDKSVQQIEAIVWKLLDAFDQLDAAVQARINERYELMRTQYAAAPHDYARGLAVARFLEAIEPLPGVRAVVGELIDATKGRVTRGGGNESPPDLLDRLPSRLALAYAAAAVPLEAIAPPESDALPPPPAPAPAAPPPDGQTRGAGSVPPPVCPPLTRYPDIDYPNEVEINRRTSLCVSLLVTASDQSDRGYGSVSVADSSAETLPQVDVIVQAKGFDIQGSNLQTLEVSRTDACDVRFTLIPREAGEKTIKIDLYQNDRRLGTLKRFVNVVAQPGVQAAALDQPTLPVIEFAPLSAVAPDLELYVTNNAQEPQTLLFVLHSTIEAVDLHHAPMGSVTLQGTPLDKFKTVYTDLSQFARGKPATPDDVAFQQRRLESLGRNLWDELFSAELKAAYWQFKDHVQTLLITSDEPWIPWEIIKPYRFDAANIRQDEPFLCEQFTVARWLSGPGMADRVPVAHVRPVAPAATNLESVQDELSYLERVAQLRAGVLTDPPYNDRARVIDLWENGSFNVLHFAAHGAFDSQSPDNSGIDLTGGPLRPSDLFGRFGGARPRPIVFINACHGARNEYAFTGLGGWADRLVRQARVGAFVGAAWEVNDRLALLFAQTFYTALLKDGKSLGESVRSAREAIRAAEPSNSTWLAYVLYADPSACVTS